MPKLVWQTSPALTLGSGVLRFLRALLPVVTLYVGKLIPFWNCTFAPAMPCIAISTKARRRRCFGSTSFFRLGVLEQFRLIAGDLNGDRVQT